MKEETLPGYSHNESLDRAGLARYVLAATLARLADGGGVLAVILLCVADSHSAGWAGTLAACITLPHLAGPFIARRLDTAHDSRRVIAAACLIHTGLIVAATLTFSRVPLSMTGGLLAGAGLCGPLLTGGISTHLPAIAGRSRDDQRRVHGWDVATYGLGGTVGPALVAALAAWFSPSAALYTLAGATAMAAYFILRIPVPSAASADEKRHVPGTVATMLLLVRNPRLRRTLYLTVAVAFCVAVLPITAVSLATALGVAATTAACLTVAYGSGNLVGSVCLMIRPLVGEPDTLMTRFACFITAGVFLIMLNMHFVVLLMLFFVTGMLNAGFFGATLAARSEYSPSACRGQVFVWVGAMKITAGSLGTAAAGRLMLTDSVWPLAMGIIVLAIFIGVALTEQTLYSLHALNDDERERPT
ncbi:MFS transporter [Pantoea sp. S18]|uniref:MFS transporter n=1 Tax=Pantoea sp. S18 TaxID=3019892 RepID=UPI002B20D56C|nr:MFS transporter [Pantoea sp. S18]MEA5101620.1 MFS transporter [Pantoea sp. S18]